MSRGSRRGDWRAVAATAARWSAACLATFSLAAVAGFAAAVGIYSGDLPTTSDLRENYRPPQVNRYLAADGTPIGVSYQERRTVTPMSKVPPVLVEAVIAAEDSDFFEHEGLDYPGIMRAMWVNVRSGKRAQGASTITQQVVRTFYLGREKTYSRKFKELLLARRLEQNLSKEEILFLYLNQIYLGHGCYGIQEASRLYFGKDVEEVGLAEAALLAALPKGPELYTPLRNPDRAIERRNWVLGEMARHGYVSEAEAAAARLDPVPTERSGSVDADLGPEFVDRARAVLVDAVGAESAALGGYEVWTTMDPQAQAAARAAVHDGLMDLDARRGYRGPIKPRGKKGKKKTCHEWPPGVRLEAGAEPASGKIYEATIVEADDATDLVLVTVGDVRGVVDLGRDERYNPRDLDASTFAREGCQVRVGLRAGSTSWKDESLPRFALEMGPQAALVSIDPRTREVVAMVGGDGYGRGDFNRALRALRQPGSAFKPFVYLEALRSRKFTAASVVDDAPVSYDTWRPENYETWKFQGPVRLRRALAGSINVVAVRLIDRVGPEAVVELAGAMGIGSELEPVMGLALGGSGVRPVELANAYATIASGGTYAEPIIVKRIVDPAGEDVDLGERAPARRVVGEAETWVLTSLLRGVVEDPDGTGKAARKLGRPAAGKTGTSNRARDAWFAGFTPELATVVWVGFDDYKSLGKRESGGRSAVPIWTDYMVGALEGGEKRDFPPPPDGVESAMIDPASGLLAWEGQEDAIEEWFLDGTVPAQAALPPDVLSTEDFMMGEGFDMGGFGEPGAPDADASPGLDGAAADPAPAPDPTPAPESPPPATDDPPPQDAAPPPAPPTANRPEDSPPPG